MLRPEGSVRFEQIVLLHLDSAVNLARWLVRNRADTENVVQEAVLRAHRFFGSFPGGEARTWLLQIVHNACYSWLEKNRPSELMIELDVEAYRCRRARPKTLPAQADERQRLLIALESLPVRSREVLALREMEGCSYREIAEIADVPLGTVMSTVSLARERLQQTLTIALTIAVERAVGRSE